MNKLKKNCTSDQFKKAFKNVAFVIFAMLKESFINEFLIFVKNDTKIDLKIGGANCFRGAANTPPPPHFTYAIPF